MEITIELRAMPEKSRELLQTFQALLPTIRKANGNRTCRVFRKIEDRETLILSAQWETPAMLEHYMSSSNGGALLGAIDLLSETAKIRFGQNLPWEGIGSLKKMRKAVCPE